MIIKPWRLKVPGDSDKAKLVGKSVEPVSCLHTQLKYKETESLKPLSKKNNEAIIEKNISIKGSIIILYDIHSNQ